MVLNVDLNALPTESRQLEGDVSPVDMQHEHIAINGSTGSFTSPIDADAVDDDDDDDVMLVPSSAWFPQAKSPSRRKRPVTIVIDDGLETNTGQSGVVEEPTTTLSLCSQKLHTQVPLGRMIIDCDLNANEKCILKMDEGVKEASEPAKEANLTCPVCMCTLNEPSTTVCGHLFCRNCIETAISKQKKCPTCRKKLTKRNFHRIYIP